MKDEIGRDQGSIITLEDITERKKTDAHLQRISKLVALGQMAAGIAHEVRNPLSGITYVLDDVHDYLQGDQDRRSLIESAIKEVDRLDSIVTGLLDFAQVNRTEFYSHNVNDILEDALLWVKKQLLT
jgi:C4-dicarboxylate-specific signal transduction histidine kinase